MMTMTSGTIDKDRLKAHANKHITTLLDALNIEYVERGPLYQGRCPIKDHPGDNNNRTAFSWKEEANGWVCWSHGCDNRFGGDIFGLVRGVLGVNFRDAVQFVFDTLTERAVDVESEVMVPKRIDTTRPRMHKPLSEKCLEFLDERYDYPLDRSLLDRGYDPWILRQFKVGFWHQFGTFMNDRLIFPIRDHQGFLIGFSGRTVFPKERWEQRRVQSKWIHGRHFSHWPSKNGSDFFTSSVIYNLHRAKEHLVDGTLILVEGPLDVIKIVQAGIENVSGLLGVKNFSPAHRTLLIGAGVNRLRLAFDPDNAGKNGTARITELVQDFFHVDSISLPDKDPGDMEVDDIRRMFA